MDAQELQAWLRLTLTPGVGNATARKLLVAFGSAQAIFEQSHLMLRQVCSEKLVNALQTEPSALAALLKTTLDWQHAGDDRRIATLGDAAYPTTLLNIEDPPLMLYMLGTMCTHPDMNTAITHSLAIVGSRNPTSDGESNARHFAKAFGEAGLCVVSGLALGIDGASHEGALLGGGETIAIVGTGLNRVYPKDHLTLAHRIAKQGMLVSEFPLGTPPLTTNFPKRNRIISGLSLGTLVVEATLKSGSLITARLASEQGKEVFAIPGSIHSPQSRGCHALIQQGAKLVEVAQDVLEELRWSTVAVGRERGHFSDLRGTTSHIIPLAISRVSNDVQLSGPQSILLTALGFSPINLDVLQARSGLPTDQLQAQLLELELEGQLTRLPGGLFQRLAVT